MAVKYGTAYLSAGGEPGPMRPIAEIEAEVNAAMSGTTSEVPDLVATSIDPDKVWANYNKGRATPVASAKNIDRAEVARRITGA